MVMQQHYVGDVGKLITFVLYILNIGLLCAKYCRSRSTYLDTIMWTLSKLCSDHYHCVFFISKFRFHLCCIPMLHIRLLCANKNFLLLLND